MAIDKQKLYDWFSSDDRMYNLKTKQMFKVGDRVEVIAENWHTEKGTTLKILEIEGRSACLDNGFWIGLNKLKLINDMRKEDLKTGMRVELRDGDVRIIMHDVDNEIVMCGNGNANYLDRHDEDMINHGRLSHRLDIIKVYDIPNDIYELTNEEAKGYLLWERNEVKEYTMAELEEKLGEKIKIKK